MKKTKAHIRYKTKPTKEHPKGISVPGGSTIAGLRDKSPYLMRWAYNCGRDGIDYNKARDKYADIGTVAHYLVECHIKNQLGGVKKKPNLEDYAPSDVKVAKSCFNDYLELEKKLKPKYLCSELALVDDKLLYGGTLDVVVEIDGETRLWDIKTSKAVYESAWIQTAGYVHLWNVNKANKLGAKNRIRQADIVHLRREDGTAKLHEGRFLEVWWEIFNALRVVYHKEKFLKNRGALYG